MNVTSSKASHHSRILDDVREKILKGHWLPGSRIPFETEMASQYGVSRMTVNKVLTQLAREGFLERRRKGGTFVSAPRLQSAVLEITDLRQEVINAGRQHTMVLLTKLVRAATLVDRKALQLGERCPQVMFLQALHKADGIPYCHEERLINLSVIPEAAKADFQAEPAGSWLLRMVPWTSGEHVIRAVAATVGDAKQLKVPLGSPCLEITRVTKREGEPLTSVRLAYPGSQQQVIAHFIPRASAT